MGIMLSLLGNAAIEYNGAKIDFKLRKAESIIYYVALCGSATRDELKSVFWHDKGAARAAANLRNALYLINKSMPGALLADSRCVSIDKYTSDLDSIEPIKSPAVPIPPIIFRPPLKNLAHASSTAFSEWIDAERKKIKTRITQLLRARVSSAYESRDFFAAEDALSALFKFEPCDEDCALELMELYTTTGRVPDAIDIYNSFSAALKANYGLRASERAQEYFANMLAPEAKTADAKRFWCRKDKLSAIRSALLTETGMKVVFVHGEAGIGKTALINKAISTLPQSRETFVLWSKGMSLGRGYDYASWNNLVVSLGKALQKTNTIPNPRCTSILSGIFPSFMNEESLSFNADIAMLTEINPVTLSMIMAELLGSLAAKARTVLVLEDVHSFDVRSLELFEALLAVIDFPLKIILSSRPESVKSIKAMLQRQGTDAADIPMHPFSRSEILYITRSVLPHSTVENLGVSYFIEESEGLPLMLFEMLRLLREDPHADCSKGLGALIMERTNRLSEKERTVLRAVSACVAGSPEIISETAGLNQSEAVLTAEMLFSKGLLEEHIDGNVPLWCFTHQKLREYIYGSIPFSLKRELHRKAAGALEKIYSPSVWNPDLSAAIHRHRMLSGDKALELRQYLRELAFDVTLNHDLFPILPDKVLLTCSTPFSSRSETEKKIANALAILDRLENRGGTEYLKLEATCFEIIGGYMVSWGEYRKGLIYINEASAIAKKNGFHDISSFCLKHLAYLYLQTENQAMLLKTSRELLHTAKEANMPQYFATAVRHIGIAYFLRHNLALAEKIFAYSIKLFELLKLTGKNYILSILVAKCYLGEIYQRRGELAHAAALLKECTDTCKGMGLYWGRSYFLASAADIALDRNAMDEFFEYADEGTNLFESYKGGRCGYKLYSLKAIADIERFDYAGAKRAAEKAKILLTAVNRSEGKALYHLAQAWNSELSVEERRGEAKISADIYRQIGFTSRAEWIEKKLMS